ncbi:aldolase [Alicyclobacillus ferrooxydans]|uniref:Aldolase n=1 Tax=Alicyclobacillus ferrooxydans TaxID=471514 RepID=A0A0N8PMQ4_9BACL|nr:aldolase [Alicyclobacillus ferrooxydans]KPV39373.1 aldolase [Alicyclobacillus ferrooxydans]
MFYKAFGLTVSSEIYFSELESIRGNMESPDIRIQMGNLTELHFPANRDPIKLIVQGNVVAFQFYDMVRFAIEEGKVITVSPMEEADEDLIRLFILGTCMSAILIQRKILPVHGSTVLINGKAYAFVGDSGAGKSTLASAFLNQGYHLLTDDVVAVTFPQENVPFVVPSYPQQKLWEESLNQFGLASSNYSPLFKRNNKYAVPIPSKFHNQTVPLAGIFELEIIEGGDIEVREMKGINKLRTLSTNTYRNFIIPQLGLMEWHFNQISKIANSTKIYNLKRPSDVFTAHELVGIILKTIEGGNVDVSKLAAVK